MVHDHVPLVPSAVHVDPVLDHDPVVASVSEVELAVAKDNCTVAPIGAEPVNVKVRVVVMLSVDEVPLSDAVARSGVVGVGIA